MCLDCRNKADEEKHRRWAEAHPEEAKERYRRYDERHKEARRARWHNNPEYKERNKQAARRYKEKNRDKVLVAVRQRWRKIRETVIAKYGGGCACCGEARYEFLCLDHVNGGGTKIRRADKSAIAKLYRLLALEDGVLPDYRVLCHNCNQAYGLYGYCPHQRERQ